MQVNFGFAHGFICLRLQFGVILTKRIKTVREKFWHFNDPVLEKQTEERLKNSTSFK